MRLGSSNTTQKENATFLNGIAQNLRDWEKEQISKSTTKTKDIRFSATKEVIHDEFVARTRSQPRILP
jgi:hypothetical protein